jgi:hypothetical protein
MTTVIDDHAATGPVLDGADRRPPGPGRALWVLFGSLFAIGALAWGAFNLVDLLAHEVRTERFSEPAAELTRIEVDNAAGSVRIVGTDGDAVDVEAEVSDGLRETGFSREVVGSTLRLRGTCPVLGSMWCRVSYRIELPRHLDIDIDTDNDRVDVRNVDGDIVIDSDNGRVELADVSGTVVVRGNNGRIVGSDLTSADVDASTDNGGIELEFSDAPDRVRANGNNGSIDIVVPEIEPGYDVIAETDNGRLDLDQINDNPDSPHTITVETDNGGITVRHR